MNESEPAATLERQLAMREHELYEAREQLSVLTHDLEAAQAERNILQGQLDDCSESALLPRKWSDNELLANLCVTAEEQRRLLEHLNNAERTGAVSSLEIEDAAKGDPRIHTKHYVGSLLAKEDVDAALAIHAYAHRRAAELAMNGWADTINGLQAAQAAD